MLPEYHWIAGERLSLFLSHLVEPRWSPKMVQFSVKLFVLNGGDMSPPPEICCKTNLSDVSHYNLAGFSLPRARLS